MHIRQPKIKKVPILVKIHSIDYLHQTHDQQIINITDPNEIELELVDNFNYLGIIIDSNFKWTLHIDKLRTKLRQVNHRLFHLSFFCNKSTLIQAYYSLFGSYLRYGVIAWGTACQSTLLPIKRLQQTAIRRTINVNNSSFLNITTDSYS